MSAGVRVIEEYHNLRLDEFVKKNTTNTTSNATTTIDISKFRSVGERLSDLGDLTATETAKLTDHMKVLDRQIEKILRNSLYGGSPMPTQFGIVRQPLYTAELFSIDEGDLVHRVKIRCPNYSETGRIFPSESHACEHYAAEVVAPWIKENSARPSMQMSYAVFAFEDITDATLCYMRFK